MRAPLSRYVDVLLGLKPYLHVIQPSELKLNYSIGQVGNIPRSLGGLSSCQVRGLVLTPFVNSLDAQNTNPLEVFSVVSRIRILPKIAAGKATISFSWGSEMDSLSCMASRR